MPRMNHTSSALSDTVPVSALLAEAEYLLILVVSRMNYTSRSLSDTVPVSMICMLIYTHIHMHIHD